MVKVNKKYNELIIDFLQGKLSSEKRKEFEIWLTKSPYNQSYFESIKKIWEFSEPKAEKEFDTESALQKVNRRIKEIEENNIFETNKTKKFPKYYAAIASIAAVLVLGLILSIFLRHDNTTILMAVAESQHFILPDNTEVTLEPNAKLTYNKNFNTSNRDIFFEGSAHFDVAKNPEKPFCIKSGSMIVEVLGTEFDIKAEKESTEYYVDLHSGKVKMYCVDEKGQQQELITLIPGERGTFNTKNNRIERQYQSSNNNIFARTTGILDFNNVTLLTVTESLSQAYGIEIYLDEKYNNLILTARFENETLESIFDTMAAIFNLQIVRIGNTVTIR